MHFLLRIADRLDLKRKSSEDTLHDDLKKSTRDDKYLLNQIEKESRQDHKIMSESKILLESKINKIEKIMQTDNALSNQQLIYCNRQRENKSQKSLLFEKFVIIRKLRIC